MSINHRKLAENNSINETGYKSPGVAETDIGSLWPELALAGHAIAETTRKLAARYDLGPRGALILDLLTRGIHYPAQLGSALGVGRNLISAEISRLITAGLITSSLGEVDGRYRKLALTLKGEEERMRTQDTITRLILPNLASFSPNQIQMFATMLRTVRGD